MHLGFLILIMLLIVAPRLVYNEMEIARMKEELRKRRRGKDDEISIDIDPTEMV